MLASHLQEITVHSKSSADRARGGRALDERLAQATERKLEPKDTCSAKATRARSSIRRRGRRDRHLQDVVRRPSPHHRLRLSGDFIGLGVLGEQIMSAQATCAAKVRCFSAPALESLPRPDASLGLKLYKSVCQDLMAARSLLVTVGQRSWWIASRPLARFAPPVRRGVADDVVKLAMRRSGIADLLGLTIETVSRTFTKLREMGVVDVEQGGTTVTLLAVLA